MPQMYAYEINMIHFNIRPATKVGCYLFKSQT